MTQSLPSRHRKRSGAVRVSLLGLSAFTLAACEEPIDLTFFSDVEQCRSAAEEAAEFSVADCDRSFAQAMAEHRVVAPRYDDHALCEEQHGQGACGTEEEVGLVPSVEGEGQEVRTAGSSFAPFFMGYMMGNMLSSRGPGGYAGRAIYTDTQGRAFTSQGRQMAFNGPGTTARGSAAMMQAPNMSRPLAPMTRATVSSRGGFGAARSASFGG